MFILCKTLDGNFICNILFATVLVMDSTTEQGMHPEHCALRVLQCVEQGTDELILATLLPKLAIYIRTFTPSWYFWLMQRRAQKQRQLFG